MFRHGLEQALAGEPDIDVVGVGDGRARRRRAGASRSTPDVVLMDVRMPVLTGVEATARIRTERPDVKVVILSGSDDEQDLFAAVRAGAAGLPAQGGVDRRPRRRGARGAPR